MQDSKLKNWLALYFSCGIGGKKMQAILQHDPLLRGLPGKLQVDWFKVNRALEWAQQPNCYILPLYDSAYPGHLRNINDPPAVLFIKGNVKSLSSRQIAIIGARKASKQGMMIAENLARELVRYNITITGGLAYGIDAAAHRGALEHGHTVAVLGSGIENIYPAPHYELAQSIIKKGVLVSELYIDEVANSYNFPKRNRIISGLSLGVVIVEAELNSGSLITARYALEQGREVFAVPGAIYNKRTRGCHYLLKQGAKLVENVDDILEELYLGKQLSIAIETGTNKILNKKQNLVLKVIKAGVNTVENITTTINTSLSEAYAVLTDLEKAGLVVATSSGYQLTCK